MFIYIISQQQHNWNVWLWNVGILSKSRSQSGRIWHTVNTCFRFYSSLEGQGEISRSGPDLLMFQLLFPNSNKMTSIVEVKNFHNYFFTRHLIFFFHRLMRMLQSSWWRNTSAWDSGMPRERPSPHGGSLWDSWRVWSVCPSPWPDSTVRMR